MTKTEIAKKTIPVVVGFLTAATVKEMIKNSTDAEKLTDKVTITVAGYVLGAIAADAAKDWTDAKIDELIAWWTKNVTEKF